MNSNQFLQNLYGKNVFVISPHFDDAILSAGMLISELRGKANVTVVNVFTKAHKEPYTLSAKHFLKSAKVTDALMLYKDREKNDTMALQRIHTHAINLEETDALFRKKKKMTIIGKYIAEFDHVYPTYRWHVIGKISSSDPAILKVKRKLQAVIPKNAIVVAPFGVGNHVDHMICHILCKDLFPNCIFYLDFPYIIRSHATYIIPAGYMHVSVPVNRKMKQKLVNAYTSQVNGLFPGGIVPKHKEQFFTKHDK